MKSQKIYTAVVVGCGRIGASFEFDPFRPKPASHAASFTRNKRVKLLAVVDADEVLAQKAAKYFGVPFYLSAETCFKELHPDVVAIATPPSTHEGLVKLALAYTVKGIICEKPFSHSEKSAKAMLASLEKSPVVFIVNHQRRFFPLFQKLQKRIAKGELGFVQQVTCYYNNGLYNNGTHTVDTLRYLLQSEVAWVSGIENQKNTAAPIGDRNIDGLIGFKNGTVASLQSVDVTRVGIHDFHMVGDKAHVSVTNYGYRVETKPVVKSDLFKGSFEISQAGVVQEDVRSMLEGTTQHLVDCLDKKCVVGSTAEDGLQTMHVLDALVASAKSKKIITL